MLPNGRKTTASLRSSKEPSADTLSTERLVLRRWTPGDREPFAALNADPVVMEHFPALLTRAESDALVDRIEAHLGAHGWGRWAVQVRGAGSDAGRFAGFAGLAIAQFQVHFTPATEIGWRLARWAWGYGYATEAASAALGFAFSSLGLTEVVSITAVANVRSQAVMRRLGMTRDADGDFENPALPADHALSRHVLYRLPVADWRPPDRTTITRPTAASGGQAGKHRGELRTPVRLRPELAQDTDAAEPHPVDQQVLRGEVELQAKGVAGAARIADAYGLGT